MTNLNLRVEEIGNRSFTVKFNKIPTSFGPSDSPKSSMSPIESYNVILVKNHNRSTFSIATAASVLHSLEQHLEVPHLLEDTSKFSLGIEMNELRDSDGDELKLDAKYVVFIYAIYEEKYKMLIDNYDDYLSSASSSFQIID